MNLQDKIKEYLCSGNYEKFGLSTDDMAKDIMDIITEDKQVKKEAAAKTRNENKFYYKYGR